MRLEIFGAGMAGLLTANVLRRYRPTVHEAQSALPDNHGALLRFRTDAVARATGQTFQQVKVNKAIKLFGVGQLSTSVDLRMSNMYSLKVGGEVLDRSILNLEPVLRYVAPDSFLSDLAVGVDIKYGNPINTRKLNYYLGGQITGIPHKRYDEIPEQYRHTIISTIPMPVMMELIGWKDIPEFRFRSIWSYNLTIVNPRVNVFQTIYYPDPEGEKYYRASITGNRLTVEYVSEPTVAEAIEDAWEVASDFGITLGGSEGLSDGSLSFQRYGKLLPIDERIRKAFIFGLSSEYGIYSIGRFATWRQILMDDVVTDVNRVLGFILDRDQYTQHLQ